VIATMDQFIRTHYVPILRWKRAEQVALAKLTADTSNHITPLIELVADNFKNPKKRELSSEEVASKISHQLFQFWGERPFFVDLHNLSQGLLTEGPSHFLVQLSNYASITQVSLIPVTGISRDPSYQSAVRNVIEKHNQGACFRLSREDINRQTLARDLKGALSFLEIAPDEVDLLIDFQTTEQSVPPFSALCAQIPDIHEWRNFIVASGAFPEDLRQLKRNQQHTIDRLDWILWRDQAIPERACTRLPTYSDYTIQYPQYLDRAGPFNYSASIRYTADEYWVIMRGESVSNEEGPGTAQWPANAQLLCERPEYSGDNFSYGDKYIKEMISQYDKPGSPTTWLRAGINHHMTFVVRQLATLVGTSTVALS